MSLSFSPEQKLRLKLPQDILTIREFDLKYNVKEGTCKFNAGNSITHELAKAKLMILLMKNKNKVYSEVIFKTGGRADIVNATQGTIIEILHSESFIEAKRKESYYPSSLGIEYLKAEEILQGDFAV